MYFARINFRKFLKFAKVYAHESLCAQKFVRTKVSALKVYDFEYGVRFSNYVCFVTMSVKLVSFI